MLPCHRSSHKPDIYSSVLVYPVTSLVQCSLLRILLLNHVRESALHCKVYDLPQACVIGHFSLQPRSDLMLLQGGDPTASSEPVPIFVTTAVK